MEAWSPAFCFGLAEFTVLFYKKDKGDDRDGERA
jgi:hypothetical protein